MSIDWQEITLGNHVKIKHGYAFDGESITSVDNGKILVTPGNFNIGGGFKADKFKFFLGVIPEEYVFQPKDIIITMTDLSKEGDTLGYPAFVPDNPKYTYLHNQRVGKVIFEDNVLDKRYLYYLLCAKEYRHEILASATGTSIKHTSPKRIEAFSAIIPLIPEQRAIAAVLGALDDKIELNQRTNATLEMIARALFKSWFVDFDPVRAKMDGRQLFGMDAETAALFPSHLVPSVLGDMPERWEEVTLEKVAILNSESWSNNNHPDSLEYVDLANAKWGAIESTQFFSWRDAPSRARRVLRPGDTIVGTVRPGNGSYSFIGKEGLTGSTGFAVLRPKKTIYREIVCLIATEKTNIERLAHLADGGAYPAVRPDVVLATPFVYSDEKILSAFSKKTSALFDHIQANRQENRALARLRDYLLPKLISGDIRIRDAKKFVEAA